MPASLGCLALDLQLTGGTARRGMDPSGEGQHRPRGGLTASAVPPPGTTPLHRPPGGLLAACQAPRPCSKPFRDVLSPVWLCRRPPVGFLPKSSLHSRRSSNITPKLNSVTVAASAEVLSIGPHNAWDSSKAWAAAQASQDPHLEIKGRPVTSTASRQIRVTV